MDIDKQCTIYSLGDIFALIAQKRTKHQQCPSEFQVEMGLPPLLRHMFQFNNLFE